MSSVPNLANNPYAKALEGLHFDDPVKAFFDFCREREAIRLRREQGEPRENWTKDPVFQQGRFLNVFREDDRVTKALFQFVKPLVDPVKTKPSADGDTAGLIQGLFFARWCNRDTTLQATNALLLSKPDDLKKHLTSGANFPQPWCNETAYPVETVTWEGVSYSRLDSATLLFHKAAPWLLQTIKEAAGDVVKATKAIAAAFNMKNDFPVFMAVMDLAWFRPDLIDPASPVPTGIGAVAFLDILQKHLKLATHEEAAMKMIELQAEYWPEAKRSFQPIDVEYLSCECRKYYSYVNGTKSYEGKNVFKPGKSPMLPFEAKPREGGRSAVQVYVIAGAPCSGKSTLVKALAGRGFKIIPETAEEVIRAAVQAGVSVEEQRLMDPVGFQMDLLRKDFDIFDKMLTSGGDGIVIADTSFIETLVFSARAGIEMSPTVKDWLMKKRFNNVFFLASPANYQSTEVRMESQQVAMTISREVEEAYKQFGYQLVPIPAGMSLSERYQFVEKHIRSNCE